MVDFQSKADVYIINTCTVTKTAEQKARQMIRRVKREHPGAVVVVTGCYPQTDPKAVEGLPEADLIIGVAGRSDLVEIVQQFVTRTGPRIAVEPWRSEANFEVYEPEFSEKTRAFLKIEDGCDAYCSYCRIPFARGPVRSLPPARVISEIKRLRDLGFKELVLVGIHLGFYGKDHGSNLARLLIEIEEKVSGGIRIRLSSVEPTDFDSELIEVFSRSSLLCPHLHIPLQSGSERVLAAMNRRYSPADYDRLLTLLRSARPGIAISSDLIVGFPGETEEDFAETLAFLRKQAFSRLHIFPFSPRKGTKAATFDGQLSSKKKKERVKEAERVAEEGAAQFRREMLGKIVEVLIEDEVAPGVYEGLTGEYLRTRVRGSFAEGALAPARVIDVQKEPLVAEAISLGVYSGNT